MAGGAVVAITIRGIDDFSKTFSEASSGMDKMSGAFKAGAAAIATAVAAATAAMVKMGTESTKLAIDFESSMSKITGLVGVNREQVQEWEKDILRLGGETARAPQELADAMFFITSAGLRGSEALDVLEMSAKGAAAGLGETKTIADLVTSAMNAYGSDVLSAQQATDILTAAVREGKAEAPALVAAMGQVLPVASEMSIGFDQISGAIAAMTRTGTDAATASTQLRQIMVSILKPSAEAEKQLQELGLSSEGLRKQIGEEGLFSTLMTLRDAFGDNEEAAAKVFGNIRALAGVLDLTGANAAENAKIFENVADSAGMMEDAFGTAAETSEFKFKQMRASLKAAGIELGQQLIPVIIKVAEIFTNEVLPAIKPLIPVIGDFLTSAIKGLIPYIPKITDAFIRWIKFTIKLFDALSPLLEPLMDLAFIILDALLDILEPLLPTIKDLSKLFGDVLITLMPLLVPLTKLLTLLMEILMIGIRPLMRGIEMMTPALEHWVGGFTKVIGAVNIVIEAIKTLIGWIDKITFGALGKVSGAVSNIFGSSSSTSKSSTSSSSKSSTPSSSRLLSQSSSQTGWVTPTHYIAPDVIRLNDFIMHPNGQIIEPHANDTIMGFKGDMPGGGITIIIEGNSIYGVNADDIADALGEKINAMIRI